MECFQAGPVPQDQSLQMIRSLNTAISGGAFNKAISNMGIAISSSQFVFAALTSRSAAGTSSASAVNCCSASKIVLSQHLAQQCGPSVPLSDWPPYLCVRAEVSHPGCAGFLDAHPPTAPAAPPKTIMGTSTDSSQTGIIAGQFTSYAEPSGLPGGFSSMGTRVCSAPEALCLVVGS